MPNRAQVLLRVDDDDDDVVLVILLKFKLPTMTPNLYKPHPLPLNSKPHCPLLAPHKGHPCTFGLKAFCTCLYLSLLLDHKLHKGKDLSVLFPLCPKQQVPVQ